MSVSIKRKSTTVPSSADDDVAKVSTTTESESNIESDGGAALGLDNEQETGEDLKPLQVLTDVNQPTADEDNPPPVSICNQSPAPRFKVRFRRNP